MGYEKEIATFIFNGFNEVYDESPSAIRLHINDVMRAALRRETEGVALHYVRTWMEENKPSGVLGPIDLELVITNLGELVKLAGNTGCSKQ